YTSQIASALLHGQLGLREKPPDWLNEMIPQGEKYYSAFPLGAVISMLPVALLRNADLIHDFPGHILASLIAGLCVYFFFQLANAFSADHSSLEIKSLARRIMLALFPIFGTWTWCNLGFGGAWQIALGLGLLGQTAALYFTLVRPLPLVAGAFFTLAFGNRTELLITLPLYLYLFWRQPNERVCPWNNYTMLFQGYESFRHFPYIRPDGFGCSIFLASPFLCLLFRQGGRYKMVAWVAISILTLVLWLHGNPGSWQFSYRYAMILLPWIFLLLTGNGPAKISVPEISLFTISVAINAIATWQFLWTDQIQPLTANRH